MNKRKETKKKWRLKIDYKYQKAQRDVAEKNKLVRELE